MNRWTPAIILAALGSALPTSAQLVELGPPHTATGGFLAPTGLAVDEVRDLVFVADTANQRLKYAPVASLSGAPTWSELGYLADPAAAAAQDGPQGVAVDRAGNVYAVDTFAGEVQLYRYDAASATDAYDDRFAAGTRRMVANVAITFPRDVAVGPDGRVYLLDSGNGRILVAAGSDAAAWSVWHADGAWSNPYGLDVAPDGAVGIADTGNARIVAWRPTGRRPRSAATGRGRASCAARATSRSHPTGASSSPTR